MEPLNKESLVSAMNREGYENWNPNFDVPDLQRPRSRPQTLPGDGRTAAVLFLVHATVSEEGIEEPGIVLIRRRNDLSKHPGQIALPGGQNENGESLEQTALRETVEELGVELDSIEVIGKLNNVYIPPSDFTVTPFVAWYDGNTNFVPAEYEVAEILQVPIAHFMNPENLIHDGEVQAWNKKDPTQPRRIQAPFYAIGPHQLWGATAIMMDEFVDRLSR